MPGQPRKAAEQLLEVARPLIATALKYKWESIIDFGCGYGLHTAAFAQAGRQATGIDMLCAVTPPDPPYTLLRGDWDSLGDEGFGAGYAHHVLEHTCNPVEAFGQWARIIKPGGWLFLSVPYRLDTTRGGHVSAGWNINQLLYNAALAGWDCRKARAKYVGPSIWAIVDRPETLELGETGYHGVGWGGADKRLPAEMKIDGNVATVNLTELNWT